MKDNEKLEAVRAVLAQIEEFELEDRWAVLEQALEISTASRVPKLVIKQDIDPGRVPRDGDYLGHMVCWHDRSNLGDAQPCGDGAEWFEENVDPNGVCLPLYLYEHSGMTMQTAPFNCPWDSGQVGWIYASPEAIKKFYGDVSEDTKVLVLKVLEAEVKEYDYHLRGQVWGFEFGDDSCWGFVGDELDDTGIKDHLPEVAHSQLEEAWEARS